MNKSLLAALVLAGCLHNAQASTLIVGFGDPTTVNGSTHAGSLFDVNLYVNGLADFGSFDFSLTYDSTKMTALSLDSANIFGVNDPNVIDPLTNQTLIQTAYPLNNNVGDPVPYVISAGSVHFAESIAFSNTLYPDAQHVLAVNAPMLLGTVHFKAGNTISLNNFLNISNPIISDWNGNSLAGTTQPGNVNIQAPVPLPAAAWMFLAGLMGVFGWKKQQSALTD